MNMMRKEFITGMMDCDSAEMICGHGTDVTAARGHGGSPSDMIRGRCTAVTGRPRWVRQGHGVSVHEWSGDRFPRTDSDKRSHHCRAQTRRD